MGFKYFSNLMKQVVSIFLAHQNKAAHTFTDGFYALVAPKGYGLRLFSFVVSQMPLGFVVCCRHLRIMEKEEMVVPALFHSPVKIIAILEVCARRVVFVLFPCFGQDCIISVLLYGEASCKVSRNLQVLQQAWLWSFCSGHRSERLRRCLD